jgi:hypothetical protein
MFRALTYWYFRYTCSCASRVAVVTTPLYYNVRNYTNVSHVFQLVMGKYNTCLSRVILNPSHLLWLHNFVTVPVPYECSETDANGRGPHAMDSTNRQTRKRWWFPSYRVGSRLVKTLTGFLSLFSSFPHSNPYISIVLPLFHPYPLLPIHPSSVHM